MAACEKEARQAFQTFHMFHIEPFTGFNIETPWTIRTISPHARRVRGRWPAQEEKHFVYIRFWHAFCIIPGIGEKNTQKTKEDLPDEETDLRAPRPDDAAGKDYVYHLTSNEMGALSIYLTTYDRATNTEVRNSRKTVLGGYENKYKWNHFAVTDDGKTYMNGRLVHSTAGSHTHFGSAYTNENANIFFCFIIPSPLHIKWWC